jgi:diguanylate cyclase (GGDEF)-like protein
VRRFINSKNNPNRSTHFIRSVYSLFLSIFIISLLFQNGFKNINTYSLFAAALLFVSTLYITSKYIKNEIASVSLLAKIEAALLITLCLSVLVQAIGKDLFPSFYIVTPLLFAYAGWQGATLAVLVIIVLQIISPLNDKIFWIFPLLVSTYGLGFLIRKNRFTLTNLFTKNDNTEQIKIHRILRNVKDTELSENELNKIKEVKSAINESLKLLNESLSFHAVVLYLKGEDGLFEIEDFISQTPDSIDIGQRLNFRTGYFGWVLKTNTPFSAENLKQGDKNLFYYKKEIPVKSIFVTPIVIPSEEEPGNISSEPIGVLVVDSLEEDAFGQFEKRIASMISDGIGLILENYNLSQRVYTSQKELNSMYEFTKHLASTQDVDHSFDHVSKTLYKFLKVDFLGITLSNPETNTSELRKALDVDLKGIIETTVSHQNTLIGLANKNKKILNFDDISASRIYRSVFGKEIDLALGIKSLKSILVCPLVETSIGSREYSNNILGCLVMGRKTNRPFSEKERNLVSYICQQTAIVIENSINYLRIKELAISDALTTLYNPSHFQEMLSHSLNMSDRYGEHTTLIMIDVDDLKVINENHGREEGDSILSTTAKTISRSIRKTDIAARYGDDEFAIVLPKTDKENAIVLTQKLQDNLRRVISPKDADAPHVTFSLGVATYPDNASTMDLLIEKTERALYESKRNGRNRFTHYEDIELKESAM